MKAYLPGNITLEGTAEELASFLSKPVPTQPYAYAQTNACPMGGTHIYPEVWNSILPAPCSKCGQGQYAIGSFTVSTHLAT